MVLNGWIYGMHGKEGEIDFRKSENLKK